ncbi:hypothetical protein HDU97_003557 [Phlyctochytrium planicorne]|nr:hypothetical protein HDU97_003557 [Phlyctochytrium planicorne]
MVNFLSIAAALVAASISVSANVETLRTLKSNRLRAIDQDLAEGNPGESNLAAAVGDSVVKTLSYNQTVDHFTPGSGTFPQKYFVNDQFYKPGGPILMYIEGEAAASDRALTSPRLNLQYLAKTYNALLVALEHRYYSPDSVPTADLSIPNLKLLSSRQAILDGVEFSKWFKKDSKVPDCTKIIAVGGSYPGNMAAWYRVHHGDVFFATQASSAPVSLEKDFRQYSKAVRLGLANPIANGNPQCAENWGRAVLQFDFGLEKNFEKTREDFGLKYVENIGDVASAVTTILAGGVQYGPTYSPFGGNVQTDLISSVCGGKLFPEFVNPNATDAALYNTLKEWYLLWLDANGYVANDKESTYGFNAFTYSQKEHTETTDPVAQSNLWLWQVCTEFGYFQTAEFIHKPAYSKYVTKEYFNFLCNSVFGDEYTDPDTAATQAYWGDVEKDLHATNLIWSNGNVDPWHWLAPYHRRSRGTEFSFYHDQFHCFDLYSARPTDTSVVTKVKAQVNEAWKTIMAADECPNIVRAST